MVRIDNDSPKPIYEQIYDEFVRLIVSKVLKSDEKLPSVRELASIIRINPNTIQKAYKLLESNNYIYSLKGTGNFVKNDEDLYKVHLKKLVKELKETIRSLKKINTSDDEIISIVNAIMKGDDKIVKNQWFK